MIGDRYSRVVLALFFHRDTLIATPPHDQSYEYLRRGAMIRTVLKLRMRTTGFVLLRMAFSHVGSGVQRWYLCHDSYSHPAQEEAAKSLELR